jgi:diguanylate cyclase (GGDEF)-like protein/PAS domain S-box-containing protein
MISTGTSQTRPIRVLFVEDAEADVELVRAILKRAGLDVEVRAVATEDDLREAVRERWDIILSDFNLPALDAFGVLKVLHQQSIDTPCILVSGTVGEEIATQTMRAGARDYVLKSNLARLPAVVRREAAETQQRARRKQLETTHRALREVAFEAGRFLDPAVLARYVLDQARALLTVDVASLHWWNEKSATLELLAISKSSYSEAPAKDDPLAAASVGAAASRLAFDGRQPVIIPDYRVWPQRTTEASGSALAVPAMAGYRALGALYVHSIAPRPFGTDEAQALQLLASQIAPSIVVRQLLAALKASEQRFETAFRRNPVGIIVTRASDNVVLDVNESFLTLVGYRRDELLGQSARALGLIGPEHEKDLAAAFQVGRPDRGTEVQIFDREGGPREVVVYSESIALDNAPAIISTVVDITARRSAERMLRHRSLHDELTGLPNRAYLYERLDSQITTQPDRAFTLLLIDLDDFTATNEAFGPHGGDLLLTQVARRLRERLPASDMLARTGGDEFAALLVRDDPRDGHEVARELLAVLEAPFTIGEAEALIGASIGLASFPNDVATPGDVLKTATLALESAKVIGWTSVSYEEVRQERQATSPSRLHDLRMAIDRDELFLLYQPIFDIGARAIVGVEALLRWRHPRDGLLTPLSFLPSAERTNLMRPILAWVLRTALSETKPARLRVAVNLSVRNLVDASLPELVSEMLRETDRHAEDLTCEVTEGGAMSNPETAVRVLGELRAMGCELSIDDFGTGYSSMAYLQRLPVHELKIDRSFVQGIPVDRRNTSIVQASIALAHGLGLMVVGEGVEDEGSFEALKTLGCDRAQGYLLARPMPAAELRVAN